MSETQQKFPRGPWHAAQIEEGLFHIYSAIPEQLPIAKIDKRRDMCTPYRTVTTPAIAHLIAAAPEMYEALEALYQDAIDRSTEVPSPIFHAASNALAKARGESESVCPTKVRP